MAFQSKYPLVKHFEYFTPCLLACIEVFSSVGARKHGAYTYETNYATNFGNLHDSLESLTRHFTQMLTQECMDVSNIPHLHNMATRALMLNVRYYRGSAYLNTNERKFYDQELNTFYDLFKVSSRIKTWMNQAIWLPQEIYIMMMKLPDTYIQEIHRFLDLKADDCYQSLRLILERININIFILTNQLSNKEILSYNYDLYNEIGIPDLLFYDITELLYVLNAKLPNTLYCSFYPFDQKPKDHDQLLRYLDTRPYIPDVSTSNYVLQQLNNRCIELSKEDQS
jgi:hypothetical protein